MPRPATPPDPAEHTWSRRRRILAAAAILAATFIAFSPALRGEFIWDDDAHVTRPELQSARGLYRIWFELDATQQYYPLLHTAFWIEHQLWGDDPLPYHLTNILQHALAALLVMAIARRLLAARGFPWADAASALAAAVFALHPVQVESVAWVTEQKNTLSGLLYLSALWAYLRFDASRRPRTYALASTLFSLGLLCKTVIATLPAAVLVIVWWIRGRIRMRQDVAPLLPWFAVGALAGAFTAWVEHDIIGAKGAAFELSAAERLLLAGRVVWFYLGKLVWPANLIFIYPRWQIDAGAAWQWLFPVAAAAVLVLAAAYARRSRSPLAALLFFGGTLFPVLGFFNVYPFLFSYVADHFQYLACLGVIVLLSAALTRAAAWIPRPPVRTLVLTAIPVGLGMLSFMQSRLYADRETLYVSTLMDNPSCWLAYNNLGAVYLHAGHPDAALEQFHQALTLRPEYPEALSNLGAALGALGRFEDALAPLHASVALQPDNPDALANLGVALLGAGRTQEAVEHLEHMLRMRPQDAQAHTALGAALMAAGRHTEALAAYRRAVELDSGQREAQLQLDLARAVTLPPDQAVGQLRTLAAAHPDSGDVHFALAGALAKAGQAAEASAQYQRTLELQPQRVEAHNNLGILLTEQGRFADAIPHFEDAIRVQPDAPETYMNLAVACQRAGRKAEALAAARQALQLAERDGRKELIGPLHDWIAEQANPAGSPANP